MRNSSPENTPSLSGTIHIKNLENGRIRYSGNLTPASKSGEMVGRRVVREWNPANGNKRTWMETVDKNGNTRIVRPETGNLKTHYQFDAAGKFEKKW